jgi:hypothetical protein
MASPRWLAISLLFVTSSATLFAACGGGSSATTTSTTGGAATSSSGTGGSSGASTSAAGTGGSEPDAGPLTCKLHSYSTIKNGPCDLLAQDCPAGQTCKELKFGNGSWSTQCVTTNGLKGEGEACGADEECRAKLTCAVGRCTPVCCGATNEPCLGGICNLFITLDTAGKVNKQVCHYAKACDLLTENSCDPGFNCHIEDITQGLATCVQPSGANSPDLGACHYLNDCPDMEQCLDGTPTKSGKCHFYCYLDQTDPSNPVAGLGGCPAGQTCQSKVDNLTFDFHIPNVGLCAPGP